MRHVLVPGHMFPRIEYFLKSSQMFLSSVGSGDKGNCHPASHFYFCDSVRLSEITNV